MHRRTLLAGLAATAAAPAWAATGATHLAAARDRTGAFALHGLTTDADLSFSIPLPGRGHAAAAHPNAAQAVAFARRPGTFGLVIDCAAGLVTARLTAPPGRHFYGHGAYTADGAHLLTTENAFADGTGRIGIWDTATWTRVDEIASGGIGPHEIVRLPSGEFVVANGGIRTHPDRGREKLNLDTMRPNLTYLSGGDISETVELPDLRQASIRHLATSGCCVAMALQWEGPENVVTPLLALHRRGEAPRLVGADAVHGGLRGYAGSVAFAPGGSQVALTAPRGGEAQVFDADTGALIRTVHRAEICGVAPGCTGLTFTDGMGGILWGDSVRRYRLAWDNHLVAI